MARMKLKHVYKRYDDVCAVEDFCLDIQDKEFVVFVGPSGCGKSTTLRMIAGLEKITDGELWIDDELVNKVSASQRDMAMVFQNYALYPHMTVAENIGYSLKIAKVPKKEIEKQVAEVAKLLDLEEVLERRPAQLSGGQKQRVAMGRAIVRKPKAFLMDEPLSNLDARLRLQTREEIRRIQRETRITTIFVTHDQEEAMSISDMIVVMKEGMIQQIGKPQEVYDNPVNLFVAKFLGTPPINVFTGRVQNGKLYIGEEAVFDVKGVADKEVYVGIRPEGFVLEENGALSCALNRVEVMGRDISVVSSHEACESPTIRAIISAENLAEIEGETIRFDVKPNKIFIFDKTTEERIYFQ